MATVYYDRKHCQITSDRWKKLRDDDDYSIVRRYDNGAVAVRLRWVGKFNTETHPFTHLAPLFEIEASVYVDGGSGEVPDLAWNGRTASSEPAAIRLYEGAIYAMTENHECDANGNLIITDNDLAPPPPKPTDEPETDFAEVKIKKLTDDVGVW